MSDSEHHGPNLKAYLVIGAALAVFTSVSFIANQWADGMPDRVTTSFFIIMAVAVCKAALVGMYFMHLKFDWSKLYFMIIPAFILGAMLAFVLMPDIVLAWPK
jgi:caa(3)-type oxidase subunit IV